MLARSLPVRVLATSVAALRLAQLVVGGGIRPGAGLDGALPHLHGAHVAVAPSGHLSRPPHRVAATSVLLSATRLSLDAPRERSRRTGVTADSRLGATARALLRSRSPPLS